MSRQSVRTVKTFSSGSVSSGLGSGLGSGVGSGFSANFGGALGCGVGSGLSVGNVVYGSSGGGRSGGRYSQSVISGSSRPMSYAVSTARYGSAGGYGASGYGAGGLLMGGGGIGGGAPVISNVMVNQSLLTPVTLDFDPNIHTIRTKEKEQIRGLNDRFANMIDRVSDASQTVCDQQKCTSEVYFYRFI